MLDCYAGEGSLIRAGLNLGCNVIGVEKSPLHFPRLVEHVRDFYNATFKFKVDFS